MRFLLKPFNESKFMRVANITKSQWNSLISAPLVYEFKDNAPLAIWGRLTDTVEPDEESHQPRCIADNVHSIYALQVDVDNGCTMDEFARDYHRYSYQMYTSYSYGFKQGDRFRAIFPLAEPIMTRWLVPPVKKILKNMFDMSDESCFDRGHFQIMPVVRAKDAPYIYTQHDGELLSFKHDNFERLADEYDKELDAFKKKLDADRDKDADHTWILNCVQKDFDATLEGSRDITVYCKVNKLIRYGCSYAEIMSLRPPMGFEAEYVKKVNYIFNKK